MKTAAEINFKAGRVRKPDEFSRDIAKDGMGYSDFIPKGTVHVVNPFGNNEAAAMLKVLFEACGYSVVDCKTIPRSKRLRKKKRK